ncbi:MAG: alpha/beta fold hydrolase [Thermoanaerobaculia bacterium]|jgi:predicted alpha/beta hydrolase|nr:alpha/beta fold hydrolase [Thermoanaerobaculia bacterium]
MEREAVEGREVEVADGQKVAVRLFRPVGVCRGAVLFVPAMGVAQAFYAPLAKWLAGEGFLALTFDYRGMGLSRPAEHRRSLRGFDVGLLDWARQDCAAMIALAKVEAPDRPLCWLGHSLGGQILPFVPNRDAVARIITVASGSGYWRENSPRLRRFAGLLWYGIVPASLALFGYFPGKRLRMVGDLPHGVMAQWRRWCLDPEYAVGVEGELARRLYEGVTQPLVSFSFTDDEFMSARNTESLHAFYAGAPRTMKRFAPADLGERRVGHFGFFRPEVAESLWRPHLLPELLRD